MRKKYESDLYARSNQVQEGKSVGELGSPTRWPEAWFSKRHIIAPNSKIGSMLWSDFPLQRVFADNPVKEEKDMSEIKDMGHHHDKDFQNKYVGYMILALVLGVVGIGILGLIYMNI